MELKKQIKLAEEIAREVHKEQKRAIGRKEDYIEHPKRVANSFSTEESQIVAWLHDVLEDSDLTGDDLGEKGIEMDLVKIIYILTKKDESYLNYILRIKENEFATKIKIADIRDNLEKLSNGSLREKYLLALYILEQKGGL